jgi:hypothetical protein
MFPERILSSCAIRTDRLGCIKFKPIYTVEIKARINIRTRSEYWYFIYVLIDGIFYVDCVKQFQISYKSQSSFLSEDSASPLLFPLTSGRAYFNSTSGKYSVYFACRPTFVSKHYYGKVRHGMFDTVYAELDCPFLRQAISPLPNALGGG